MAYTNAALRAELAANFPGIDLDTTIYPNAESMLKAVTDMLTAAQNVQEAHNLAAPTGEDIQLIQVGTGATQVRDFGGSIGAKRVAQVSRAVTVFEEVVAGPVYPVLI